MPNSEAIFEAIIKGQDRTDRQIGQLTESIGELVKIDAARAERDKHQQVTNERFGAFMDESREQLARLKKDYITWDWVKQKILLMIVLSLMAAAGWNLTG